MLREFADNLTFLVFLSLLGMLINVTSAMSEEIRCFCDSSECIETGYMCKSSAMCYTKIHNRYESSSPRSHGCLIPESTHLCATNNTASSDYALSETVITCCKKDMCNYDTWEMLYNTQNRDPSRTYSDYNTDAPVGNPENGALWFRAAVIAVPITGACILIVLIIFAAHMLRKEERHHRQIQQRRAATLRALQRDGLNTTCKYHNTIFKNLNLADLTKTYNMNEYQFLSAAMASSSAASNNPNLQQNQPQHNKTTQHNCCSTSKAINTEINVKEHVPASSAKTDNRQIDCSPREQGVGSVDIIQDCGIMASEHCFNPNDKFDVV